MTRKLNKDNGLLRWWTKNTSCQHCIRAIAGEVVNSRSVYLINFGGGGQVIALKSATALILDRYAQCRADRYGASNIGTFACRAFLRNTKASKRTKDSLNE